LDLCYIVSNSDFIIANESSAPHISASLNVNKTIVISNGNHYGRFTPYPKEVYENYVGIFPDEIYDLKAKDYYGNTSELDINKISLTKVFREIDNIFKK
jgi:ADP-heptose:LPS heptosyltransferase